MVSLKVYFFRACTLALSGISANAEPLDKFYEGKIITLVSSTGAGGHHDAMARTIAQYMPAHIPGRPSMIVRNMPGAGHVRATNFMYNQASSDGLTMATVVNSVPMHQVLSGVGVLYDAKRFGWVGSTGVTNLTLITWAESEARTIQNARSSVITLGATGTGSGTFLYPHVMNQTLGTKFKIVMGYKSTQEIDLAMQRGEIQGRAGGSYASVLQEHANQLKDGKIIIVAQIGLEKEPKLSHVPLMDELAETEGDKQLLRFISSPVKVGRPYFVPPRVSPERLTVLRQAFEATMLDRGFITTAEKLQLELLPIGGDELARAVNETLDSPAELISRARKAVEPLDTK